MILNKVVMKKKIKKIILGILLLSLFFIVRYTGIGSYINLASLKQHKAALHVFVSHNYLLSVLLFIASYMTAAALSFPMVSLFTLAGGAFFGTLLGALYTNIGATLGASIAFLLYRYVLGSWIQERYKDRLVQFNQEVKKNGVWYLIMIRLIAVIPFFIANALASVAPISFFTFAWTTSLGIIPASLVYSFAGDQLDDIESMRDIMSLDVLLAFLLLALLAFIPVVIKHARGKLL